MTAADHNKAKTAFEVAILAKVTLQLERQVRRPNPQLQCVLFTCNQRMVGPKLAIHRSKGLQMALQVQLDLPRDLNPEQHPLTTLTDLTSVQVRSQMSHVFDHLTLVNPAHHKKASLRTQKITFLLSLRSIDSTSPHNLKKCQALQPRARALLPQ